MQAPQINKIYKLLYYIQYINGCQVPSHRQDTYYIINIHLERPLSSPTKHTHAHTRIQTILTHILETSEGNIHKRYYASLRYSKPNTQNTQIVSIANNSSLYKNGFQTDKHTYIFNNIYIHTVYCSQNIIHGRPITN